MGMAAYERQCLPCVEERRNELLPDFGRRLHNRAIRVRRMVAGNNYGADRCICIEGDQCRLIPLLLLCDLGLAEIPEVGIQQYHGKRADPSFVTCPQRFRKPFRKILLPLVRKHHHLVISPGRIERNSVCRESFHESIRCLPRRVPETECDNIPEVEDCVRRSCQNCVEDPCPTLPCSCLKKAQAFPARADSAYRSQRQPRSVQCLSPLLRGLPPVSCTGEWKGCNAATSRMKLEWKRNLLVMRTTGIAGKWKRLPQRLPACESIGKKDLNADVLVNKPVVVDVAQFSAKTDIIGEREKI